MAWRWSGNGCNIGMARAIIQAILAITWPLIAGADLAVKLPALMISGLVLLIFILTIWLVLFTIAPDTNSNIASVNSADSVSETESREPVSAGLRIIGKSEFQQPAAPNNDSSRWLERLPAVERPNPIVDETNRGKHIRLVRPILLSIGALKTNLGEFKLADIVPLEIDQKCGNSNRKFPCGRMARTALRALIRGRTVDCWIDPETTMPGRNRGTCEIVGRDLSEWLVAQGWARPISEGSFASALNAARINRRGQWRDHR